MLRSILAGLGLSGQGRADSRGTFAENGASAVATESFDGLKISVTKKKFPGTTEEIFETNIFTERYGCVYTYAFITEAANQDKRFRIAKDIIDEVWPRSEKKPKVSDSELKALMARILKLFGM